MFSQLADTVKCGVTPHVSPFHTNKYEFHNHSHHKAMRRRSVVPLASLFTCYPGIRVVKMSQTTTITVSEVWDMGFAALLEKENVRSAFKLPLNALGWNSCPPHLPLLLSWFFFESLKVGQSRLKSSAYRVTGMPSVFKYPSFLFFPHFPLEIRFLHLWKGRWALPLSTEVQPGLC